MDLEQSLLSYYILLSMGVSGTIKKILPLHKNHFAGFCMWSGRPGLRSGNHFTVTLILTFLFPAVTVIVAVPFFLAFILPALDTVATFLLDVLKVTFLLDLTVSFRLFPFLRVTLFFFRPFAVTLSVAVLFDGVSFGIVFWATITAPHTEQWLPSVFPAEVVVAFTAGSITGVCFIVGISSISSNPHIEHLRVLLPFLEQVAGLVTSPTFIL